MSPELTGQIAEIVAFGIDLALGLIVIEAAVLLWLRRTGRIRLAALAILLIAGAGLGLLLALRGAVAGANPALIGGALAVAGLCHALDLARRLAGKT